MLETIPRFNEYLLDESVTEARPFKVWKQDAWALRDILILYSVHFRSSIHELAEVAEIQALELPVWKVFADNLRRAGNEFLQKYMFTLQIIDINSNNGKIENENSKDYKSDEKEKEDCDGDSFKGQIKKIFPFILRELFNSTNSYEMGLLEFYTEEGDPIHLKDPQKLKPILINQENVLKEQLEQLEQLESENKFGEGGAIQLAIDEIQIELNRIKKMKIKSK